MGFDPGEIQGWFGIFNRVDRSGSSRAKPKPSLRSARSVLTKRMKVDKAPLVQKEALTSGTLQKAPTKQAEAENVKQFVDLLEEECTALDRSLQQIVDAMSTSDPQKFQSLVEEWSSSYKRSTQQLQLAYKSVQKTQKFFSSTVAIASDPTLQCKAAGVGAVTNIGASTINTFADLDFSTGVDYSFEKAAVKNPKDAPVPPTTEASLKNITGRYKQIIKLFSGLSALGASATWFARSRIIGQAERSLNLMKEDLRKIEGGDVGQVYVWIDAIVTQSNGDIKNTKKMLAKQGVSSEDLEAKLGRPLKPADLNTDEGKSVIVKLLAETMRREIIELNTFVSLEKQQLKLDAATISLSATKFGSELVGFILSVASVNKFVPEIVTSALFLASSSVELHKSRKSHQRLTEYGAQIRQGAVAIGKPWAGESKNKVEDSDYWSKVAEKKYQQMVEVVLPGSSKEQKKVPIDGTIKKQLENYGVNVDEVNKDLGKKPIETLADLVRPDVKEMILQEIKGRERKAFRKRMAGKKYEQITTSIIPFSELQKKQVPISTALKDQLKNHGIDIDKINEEIVGSPVNNLRDLMRPEVRSLIINQLTSMEEVVTGIQTHLVRMEQAKIDNSKKIRSSIIKMVRDIVRQNPKESSSELVDIYQKKFKNKFGLHIDFNKAFKKPLDTKQASDALDLAVPTGAHEFKLFIQKRLNEDVEKVAAHQETMNVSTRNFFRTLADQKVKAEKPLSKWALGGAGLKVGAGVVGLLSTVLSVVTLVGLASLGIAATWTGIGFAVLLVVGVAVGIAVLYYYKPRVFKSLFTLNAIKANYANLRIARRTFEAVQATHQRNLAAVGALNEKVNIHLSGVEMLRRLYDTNIEVQKSRAEKKLRKLGLINNQGNFDQEHWDKLKSQLEAKQYEKIQEKIGRLLLGHHLELGSFGIGRRKVNVGEWVEATIATVASRAKNDGWNAEQIRSEMIDAVKKEFLRRKYSFGKGDELILNNIFGSVTSWKELDSPSFKSNFLIFFASTTLQKEIEKQKNKSSKFYDSYNTLQKYSQEFNLRKQANAFDDNVNRIAFGTAHGKIERATQKRYEAVKGKLDALIVSRGESIELSKSVMGELEKIGIKLEWLKRDLLMKDLSITRLGDLKKAEVLRLIETHCRDQVHFEEKGKEALKIANEVIIAFAKARGIKGKIGVDKIRLFSKSKPLGAGSEQEGETLADKLAARGIDIYRVSEALNVSIRCVKDLNKPEVKDEIIRRFAGDWYRLFRDAPTQISEGLQEGLIDPITSELLTRDLGIDIRALAAGGGLKDIQKYIAMGDAELQAFLKKREYLASMTTDV